VVIAWETLYLDQRMTTAARPLRLFLIRHGEAAANTEMRYLGTRDDPLTERGAEQARLLARALAELPIQAVYSSPLSRATATADPIASALGLPVRPEARLREAAFGEWEGLTRAEVMARGAADCELLARWECDAAAAPPSGESLAEVAGRVRDLVRDLAEGHAGASIALVSHVTPIKALIASALGAPLESARRFFLDPATVSVVDWGDTPLVRLINAHGHLGWTRARWMNPSKP
jgi:probable phosphoglycerate mutase